jgi:uncharacterized membrane protein YphA (DoxX/SURF4 family)
LNVRTVSYWIVTALVALSFLSGAVAYLMRVPDAAQGMATLGYPGYMLTILGVWKLLGGLAILAPGLPRLKEWAYAGIAFDLTGASASHFASGDAVWHVCVPLLILLLTGASWALRPASRRLAGPTF